MSDEHDPTDGGPDEHSSVEQIARLDAFLDRLVEEQRPAPHHLSPQEARDQMLAAQLRLAREGVEAPTPAFLQALEREVGRAVDREKRRPGRTGVSRGRFLRAAATLAGGAGLGVAGLEGMTIVQERQQPHELVEAGNERWYAIAAAGEVPPGGIKPFSAGGLLGFLLNDEGRLHAVSAICTHMGCRLKPTASPPGENPASGGMPGQAAIELRCLCHGSRFNRGGAVVHGLAPSPLPEIALREQNGHIYALGTRETV